MSDLLGRTGTVVQPIRGRQPGEVAVKLASGFVEHLLAVSAEPVPLGATVLIVGRDPETRTLLVEPWSYATD